MAKETTTCTKCGRALSAPAPAPAYCPKCDLISALLVERYSHYERANEHPVAPPPPETFRG